MDPIALYDPINEVEHYLDGQHNGGYFNPRNTLVYGCTYQNPIIYVDPNGKQVDVVMFDVDNSNEEKKISENNLATSGSKIQSVENSFQVLAHGNPKLMWSFDENGKRLDNMMVQLPLMKGLKTIMSGNQGKPNKGLNLFYILVILEEVKILLHQGFLGIILKLQ